MDSIIKKPPYKVMHVIFNQCIRLNFGKIVFSVILYLIINMFMQLVPASLLLSSSGDTFYILLTLLLLAGATVVSFLLLYGLFCTASRLVQKTKVTAGWLFIAFNKKDNRVFKAAWIFTLIYLLITGIFCVLAYYAFGFSAAPLPGESAESFSGMFFITAAIVTLVDFFVFLPLIFTFLILDLDKECGAFGAIKQSVSLIKGQFFHFAGFVLYAAGTPLLAVVLLTIVLFVIPPSVSAVFKVPVMLLSFARICEFFKCIARAIIGICVYFFFATGRMRLYIISEEKPEGEIESPS